MFFVDIIFLDVVKIEELEDIFYFCLVLELIKKNGDELLEFLYYNDM